MWERLQPETRKKSAMIVGPWGHATAVSPKAEYPLEHGNIPADYGVEWVNSIRENKPYKYAKVNKVNYYSIGGDSCKDTEYPVRKKNKIRLYFNTDAENLRDNTVRPYQYEPEKRVDCFKSHNIYIAHEMNSVDGVLSFQSEEFTEKKEFFGESRWHMNVSSDCEDTAFFMRVYFTENGISYNLTETITSLSHICKDYKPGTKITIDLKTPPIAFTVKPGTRIRVDIASDGGIYVPHANVKGHWTQVSECKVANNSVYLDDFFIEL